MDQNTVEQIKVYNKTLKEYQDKASRYRMELEMHSNNLAQKCKELSAELGVEVTPENIEALYAEKMEILKSALQSGEEIIKSIKSEETRVAGNFEVPGLPNA